VWLVARCQDTGEIFPLKSLSWEVDIHITVNAMERNGVRATLLEPKVGQLRDLEAMTRQTLNG
jgi:hypothetical protein